MFKLNVLVAAALAASLAGCGGGGGSAGTNTSGSSPAPIVETPEDIVVFVAGADVPIPQNVFFPAWGFPPASVTVPVIEA